MDARDKREAHRRFARGDAVVMAATIAFGMGIDRPDVRWVAHTDLPRSPESWYQEIGRAGRDGAPARALLLYGAGDIAFARHRIEGSPAPPEQKRIERSRLEAMVSIAEAATCRRRILLRCFGEEGPEDCGACDVCLAPPRLFDGTVAAQKLLSTVLRTRLPSGGHFGLGHVLDVLCGRLTPKVAQFGHDALSTFGIGKDLPDPAWRGVARQLVARGALDVAVESHGELVPTEAARPILRGEAKVMLREEALTPSGKRSGVRERAPGGRGARARDGRRSPVRRAPRLAQAGSGGAGRARVRHLPQRRSGRDRGGAAAGCGGPGDDSRRRPRQARTLRGGGAAGRAGACGLKASHSRRRTPDPRPAAGGT